MKKQILVLVGVVLMLLCVRVYASDTEVESLRQELDVLKQQVEELKGVIKQQQQVREEEAKRLEKAVAEKADKKEK